MRKKYKKSANINIEVMYDSDKDIQDFMGVLNVAVVSRLYPSVKVCITPGHPINPDKVQEETVSKADVDTPDKLFELFKEVMDKDKSGKCSPITAKSGKSLLIAYLSE